MQKIDSSSPLDAPTLPGTFDRHGYCNQDRLADAGLEYSVYTDNEPNDGRVQLNVDLKANGWWNWPVPDSPAGLPPITNQSE